MFSLAPVYRFAQRAIGADHFRAVVVNDIIQPTSDDRVLDAGCGTGDIVEHFPEVDDYVGFDPSAEYVRAANDRFGERARFVESTVASFAADEAPSRTVVIAIGVLHHLDDDTVRELLDLAHRVLVPGGRLVTIDPTLTDHQHPIARVLVKSDRGRHVRTPRDTADLVTARFADAQISTLDDLLRPPYTHVIVRATRN
jgi:SAM-dependent methyltransferase